jgi:hypothetical protein
MALGSRVAIDLARGDRVQRGAVAVLAWAIALPLLLGGCSGDPEPSAEALCERIATDRGNDVGVGQIPGSHDEWLDWVESWEEMAALAPPEVKDAIDTIAKSVAKVAENAESGVDYDLLFEDPAYEPALDDYHAWESEVCDGGSGYFPGG